MKKYTYSAKRSDNKEKWYVVDAEGQVMGRLASMIAARIRGKFNPMYTPHTDTGDWIVVINADKVVLTGNKLKDKFYHRHSGYMGGLTSTSAGDLLKKRPEDVLRFAVRGMLPKNRLGRDLNKKLHVYSGSEHPHAAQNPDVLKIEL
ncbi:MAG: 50S ribosomal protein L13 [Proteobacteria bacterium]|nr:50S ribosomal protein L13 [Pseudomonadota bacterium]